jgi:FkbM family methyltransferase
LDIGANVGTFSLALAELVPYLSGIAVEPVPNSFRYLQQNLARNGLQQQVTTICAAVTADGKSIAMTYDSTDSSRATSAMHSDTSLPMAPQQIMVSGITLQELATNLPTRLDLVKVDIEGDEYTILDSLVKLVSETSVDYLLLEYHDVPGHSPLELIDAITATHLRLVRYELSSTPRTGLLQFGRLPRSATNHP